VSDSELSEIHDLIDEIDAAVYDDDWDEVSAIRTRCHAGFTRGHQWWPAAAWADYRMALDGPAEVCASVLDSSSQRYTLGPFAEVAASNHSWDEIAPFLSGTPGAANFAHERVAFGDDLSGDAVALRLPGVFDTPLALLAWEPIYGPVTYGLDHVRHDPPAIAQAGYHRSDLRSVAMAHDIDDRATCDALRALVTPWLDSKSAWVRVLAAEGDTASALRCVKTSVDFTVDDVIHHDFANGEFVVCDLSVTQALEMMHWAAASGGPNGRRRGSASGRSAIWWVLRCVAGLEQEPDVTSYELEQAFSEWRFSTFSRGATTGWGLQLIIEDPIDGLVWAIDAGVMASQSGDGH
jgi:hypothetical protein